MCLLGVPIVGFLYRLRFMPLTSPCTDFRKVLSHQDPNSIAALQMIGSKVFNKFIVHAEPMLLSYPLDEVARVALGHGEPRSLEATMERIGGSDANIVLAKSLQMGRRFISGFAFQVAHIPLLIGFCNFGQFYMRRNAGWVLLSR